jgi:hypothetical protein
MARKSWVQKWARKPRRSYSMKKLFSVPRRKKLFGIF